MRFLLKLKQRNTFYSRLLILLTEKEEMKLQVKKLKNKSLLLAQGLMILILQ